MDLKSIINEESAQKASVAATPPLAPPPPPPRRGSSIADLVNDSTLDHIYSPAVSPTLGIPALSSSSSSSNGGNNTNMLRSAMASQRASPILLTRSVAPSSSSPVPPPLLSVRSRSMSISSITDDTPPASASARNYSTQSPLGSAYSSPDVPKRDLQPQQSKSQQAAENKSGKKVVKKNSSLSPEDGRPQQQQQQQNNKSKQIKPRRYDTPPIYARKWRADWKTAYAENGDRNNRSYGNGSSDMRIFTSEVAADTVNPLASTFTNVEPYEDLARRVTSWVYANVSEMSVEIQGQVEIEAKVGTILAKETNQRLVLPVDTETLLNTDMLAGQIMFESDMGELQHRAYNMFMNDHLRRSEKTKTPIKYTHSQICDTFYTVPQVGYSPRSGSKPERLRVSTDIKTNKVVQKCIKTRIRDLMIFCPGSKFDVRISLNIEKPGAPLFI